MHAGDAGPPRRLAQGGQLPLPVVRPAERRSAPRPLCTRERPSCRTSPPGSSTPSRRNSACGSSPKGAATCARPSRPKTSSTTPTRCFTRRRYRTRYAEFLKIDFPRLPLTSDVELFRALAAKGAELVALHLLESPKLDDFLTDWPVKGDNVVEKVQYTRKRRTRLDQQDAILRRRAQGGLGVPHRRLPGLPQVAEGPQRPEAHLRRHAALPEDRRRPRTRPFALWPRSTK